MQPVFEQKFQRQVGDRDTQVGSQPAETEQKGKTRKGAGRVRHDRGKVGRTSSGRSSSGRNRNDGVCFSCGEYDGCLRIVFHAAEYIICRPLSC